MELGVAFEQFEFDITTQGCKEMISLSYHRLGWRFLQGSLQKKQKPSSVKPTNGCTCAHQGTSAATLARNLCHFPSIVPWISGKMHSQNTGREEQR